MKNLALHNPAFEYLEKGFAEWLDILGYCEMSVYNMPHIIREFLHELEKQQVIQIKDLTQTHIRNYYRYGSSRGNQKRGGGLADNYLNKHLQAIEKFLEYLKAGTLPDWEVSAMITKYYTTTQALEKALKN